MFQQVPGFGHLLMQRIGHILDIDTLQELAQSAHDGRFQQLDGSRPGRGS
jgi:hypothetical protein